MYSGHFLFLNNVKVKSFVSCRLKTLCRQTHQKWGDNVLKVCPSIQWSPEEPFGCSYCCILNAFSLITNAQTQICTSPLLALAFQIHILRSQITTLEHYSLENYDSRVVIYERKMF